MCTTASLIVRCALLRPENRGAHVRLDAEIVTDPATSPFGHTYISLAREGDRAAGGHGMKTITLQVSRFDPAVDAEPHFEEYAVRVNEGARVLHALHAVRDGHDPTLTYRYCCGSGGQCGSCAVRVDGKPVLACMEEARDGMTVEPLDLPVLKDLTVDMEPVIAKIARICPAPDAVLPAKEEIEAIKPLRDCIECLCCVSACPALQVTDFAGPTVIRQEMRLALDPPATPGTG